MQSDDLDFLNTPAKYSTTSRRHTWFVPAEGIEREVIQSDICRYLDHDATCYPGQYHNINGYYVVAYRNFTSEQLKDLRRQSERLRHERRQSNLGHGRQPAPPVAPAQSRSRPDDWDYQRRSGEHPEPDTQWAPARGHPSRAPLMTPAPGRDDIIYHSQPSHQMPTPPRQVVTPESAHSSDYRPGVPAWSQAPYDADYTGVTASAAFGSSRSYHPAPPVQARSAAQPYYDSSEMDTGGDSYGNVYSGVSSRDGPPAMNSGSTRAPPSHSQYRDQWGDWSQQSGGVPAPRGTQHDLSRGSTTSRTDGYEQERLGRAYNEPKGTRYAPQESSKRPR